MYQTRRQDSIAHLLCQIEPSTQQRHFSEFSKQSQSSDEEDIDEQQTILAIRENQKSSKLAMAMERSAQRMNRKFQRRHARNSESPEKSVPNEFALSKERPDGFMQPMLIADYKSVETEGNFDEGFDLMGTV